MEETPTLSLKQFLLRFWIWHFTVTSTFFILVVLIVPPHVAALHTTHSDLIIVLSCMLLCVVHTILILIFSMRRFSRKEMKPGTIYLLHFLLSATLAYYSGMLFSGVVIAEVIPG